MTIEEREKRRKVSSSQVESVSPNYEHANPEKGVLVKIYAIYSTEFIKSDLTEDQILPVLRELLPVLLSILGSNEVRRVLNVAQFIR